MSPCSDGGYSNSQFAELKARADLVTRLLCEILGDSFGQQVLGGGSNELRAWWDAHQQADAKRLAAEDETRRRRDVALKARLKLTQEERELLGIR